MKLVAVGDNCIDVYENIGKAYPGGNPVNVAVYCVRLGGEASYTGVVGTDQYGSLMKEKIGEKGVDVSHIRFEEGSTAITHVDLIDGERVFGDYEEGVLAEFKLTKEEIETHLNPVAYIGRCPEQVEEFLDREVKPILERYSVALEQQDSALTV